MTLSLANITMYPFCVPLTVIVSITKELGYLSSSSGLALGAFS